MSASPASLDPDEVFVAATAPFRREILAHCYRMLGSIDDAEDLVQETYLRAWRAFDRFEGRSSVRLWLHKIATMACLTALETRRRRPLPSGVGAASNDPGSPLATASAEILWLQPAPDSAFGSPGGDPAGAVTARADVRLAFIAALQHLPPRQRAVLILRDVLALQASEVADVLDTTVAAANSALQRARAQLAEVAPRQDDLDEPDDDAARALLRRYVSAFERGDLAALLETLRSDVRLEMPPEPTWFAGRDVVGTFLAARVLGSPGHWRLDPARANGQPAMVVSYRVTGPAGQAEYRPYGVQVLTLSGGGVASIVSFRDAALVARFTGVTQS